MAGYKVANVAAFGIYGLVLDAAVEGATMLTCLSDYLVGPILLQNYMEMVHLPMMTPVRFFVVLRPWSLSFYHRASDIIQKPYKITIIGIK
jgi:hypothetical protein